MMRHTTNEKQQESQDAATDMLLTAVDEILEDFDIYGEVLQTDEEGEYGPKTAIEKLRQAVVFFRQEKKR
jgi:hypothetical protein